MSKRLFVGNLNPQVGEGRLARFFSLAGDVIEVIIPLDRDSGHPRGFAFVEFAEEAQAERAIADLDDAVLEGRRIRLRMAFADRRREEGGRHRGRAFELAPEPDAQEPEHARGWRPLEDEDYSSGGRARRRKRGKHGIDRMRGRGTRRFIE